jgi:hypothetical protein
MQSKHFSKAGLLTILLSFFFLAGWEMYLRNLGWKVDYDESSQLWADKRTKAVKLSAQDATVFIGSSRIKFDLDCNTWRKITGDEPVQLAMVGSTPLPVLDDLAADEDFKGKLVVDVTEGVFFNKSPQGPQSPNTNIAYYKNETPSEKASFQLSYLLESKFVFLDKDSYSINAMLDKLRIKSRPGVFVFPFFPKDFRFITSDRQQMMTQRFLTDTTLQNIVTGNWKFFASINKEPPASGARLDSFITTIKKDCDKIKARGGQVLFVRTPSSGPFWMGEQKNFPRTQYWDKLLQETNCPGIHFTDYPAIDHFVCPEWSHLSPKDAIVFTESFVPILEEKGWKFSHKK